MRARLALACLLAAAAAGCAGAADDEPLLPGGRAIDVTTTITPIVHLFAEPVVARVVVVLEEQEFDPARLTVRTSFKPYEPLGPTRFEQKDYGRYSRLEYEVTLRCLTLDCLPKRLVSPLEEREGGRGERRAFRFPPVQILYADPGKQPTALLAVTWPTLESVSRINETHANTARFPFKTSPTPLPSVSYSIAPGWLAALLIAGAVLFLAFPAWLVWRWAQRRRPVRVAEAEPELSPLERALALVDWARERRNGADRRRALEVLAEELERQGAERLAWDARALAWSPSAPSPESADVLVARVREEGRAATA